MNESREGCLDPMLADHNPAGLKSIYIAAEFFIALLAIVGNLLVCLAVTRNRKLRTVTNYFLVSLSVADILVGLLAIPCAVLTDLGQPRHDLPLCLALLSILMVLTQSSILSLLAVAAERYVAILLPFQYRRIMSHRNACLCLVVTWILAMIAGSVPLMNGHKQCPDSEYCIFISVVDMYYMVYFNFFCCLLLPLVVMFVIYSRIFIAVQQQLRRIAMARGSITAGGGGEMGGSEGTGTGDAVNKGSGTGGTDGGGTQEGSGAEARVRSVKKSMVELVSVSGISTGALVGDGTEGDGARGGDEGEGEVGVRVRAWSGDGDGSDGDGARAGSEGEGGVEFRDEAWVGEGPVGDKGRVEVGVGAGTGAGVTESQTVAGAEVGCSFGATRAVIQTKTSTCFWTKSGARIGSAGSCSSSSSYYSIIRIHSGPAGQAKQTALRTRLEVHKATYLFLLLFLFMVCWIPINCINCVALLCPQCPVPVSVNMAAILLSHANSAINPILYAYRMRAFRRTLRGMCRWKVQPKHQ